MKREKRHVVVPRVLCFVFKGNEVLLLKSSAKKDWYGFYEPPGGHIEKGEDVVSCANREIYEETGLRVKDTGLAGVIHVTGFFGKDVMLFVTKSTTMTSKVVNSREGEPVWVPWSCFW